MENPSDQTAMDHQQLPRRKKGGLKTMPFIIANEALANVASTGLGPNMVLYLIGSFNMSVTRATNILFYQSAANNFLPVVGAFVSDSYLGRFLSIGLGSIFSFLGMVLVWLTAVIPQARPPPCNASEHNCKSPTSAQYGLLLSGFALMAIGFGGIRPCSLPFGADQLDKRGNNPNNQRVLGTFFTWYYASSAISIIIAFTGIVYIQDHAGWKVGFGVPAILMLLACLFFFLASSLYIKHNPTKSLLSSWAQVVVAAFKNRKLDLKDSIGGYHHGKNASLTEPTNKLRFLNKACIIRHPEDVTPDGVASNRWRLCTVEQAEELKALIRVMPIWSAGIMMTINLSQGSFQVLQARTMDRHITKSFLFPAGSFAMFTIGSAILWLGLYDRVLIPLASKIRGKPMTVSTKVRMGLGLFCSILAMSVSAIVEHVRRRRAIHEGYLNKPQGIVHMSAMWLVPQHCLVGIAEAFFAVGQNEFFYSELPKSMSSVAGALGGLAGAIGGLIASSVLNTVDNITKRGGKVSWIADNINEGHFESYYWLLAIMSSVNLFYFILCGWLYGPCSSAGMSVVKDEVAELKEEELVKIENGFGKESGEGFKKDADV